MSLLGAFILPHPPIIVPQIGKGEEKKIESTAKSCQEVAKLVAALDPDTIILTSPHSIMYSDYFHIVPGTGAKGNLSRFGAGEVSFHVEYDAEFVAALEDMANEKNLSAGTLGEELLPLDHGAMIPLYFINQYLKDYKLVRIGLSGLSLLDHYQLGKCITKTAEALNRRVVLVASGDLSHKLKEAGPYGFAPEGNQFDLEVTEAMKRGDFLRFMEFSPDFTEAAAECGLRSFVIMAGALDGKSVQSKLFSYEGPFGVGYAVCSFEIIGKDESRHFDQIFEEKQRELANKKNKAKIYMCNWPVCP